MFFKKQVEQLSCVLFCQLLLLSSAVPPMQELHVVTDFMVEDFRENKGSHEWQLQQKWRATLQRLIDKYLNSGWSSIPCFIVQTPHVGHRCAGFDPFSPSLTRKRSRICQHDLRKFSMIFLRNIIHKELYNPDGIDGRDVVFIGLDNLNGHSQSCSSKL